MILIQTEYISLVSLLVIWEEPLMVRYRLGVLKS
nr:MAG TPA: hypothetical protein [Bacteriophage sp.]